VNSLVSYLVIAVVLLNIFGCFWLLKWTATPKAQQHDGLKSTQAEADAQSVAGVATTGHVWDHDLREYNNPLPRWWLNLFYLTIAFGLLYLILYPGLGNVAGYLGWSSSAEHDRNSAKERAAYLAAFEPLAKLDIAQLTNNSSAMQMAQNIYNNNCAACHGSDARGAKGFPNLRDADWLYGGDAETISATLHDGRIAAMPGWQEIVGEQGIKELVAYTQQLSGAPAGSYSAEQASAGMAQYAQFCIACHGPEGTGNQAMGAPNLTDQIWLYGGDAQTLKESIAKGRAGVMPAQKELLTEAQIKVMTAWVIAQNEAKPVSESAQATP
jgi:cytochrome c oxidase cbb3-type subunit III